MGAAPSQLDAPDWRIAMAAGFAGAPVDAVFQLKETSLSIGIHVVRNRGTAEADGVFENPAQRQAQPLKLGGCQPVRPPPRPDSGLKQALVRIDVSHTGEESLIQQRRLDGHEPLAEERGKFARTDRERLGSGRAE